MRTTITIRAEDSLRAALEERARSRGTTVSALIREILVAALSEQPVRERSGYLEGKLSPPPAGVSEPWRERLRERNWRK